MTRVAMLGRSVSALAVKLSALVAFLVMVAMTTYAEVLKSAAKVGEGNSDFTKLVDTANSLTDKAMIPTIAIAPLAAVAGAFALMIGGGGQRGAGGVKLIGGAIGAVVVVAGAKGLAA